MTFAEKTRRLGVCYYPEHWPREWWADDAARMIAMGITQVRVGEFAGVVSSLSPGASIGRGSTKRSMFSIAPGSPSSCARRRRRRPSGWSMPCPT